MPSTSVIIAVEKVSGYCFSSLNDSNYKLERFLTCEPCGAFRREVKKNEFETMRFF